VKRGCHLGGQHHPGPAFSAEHQSWRTTSDAPCRAPTPPGKPGCFEEPGPLPPLPHQWERLIPAQSAFPRQVLPGVPLSQSLRFTGTRHRSRGFATDDPASDALSPSERSRVGGLDPSSVPRTLRSRARRATRRLSTSAIDTVREHNHESPNSAEPRQQSPADAADFHGPDLSIATLNCGWQRLLRDAASQDFTGQGPCPRQLPRCLGTSRHDRSRRELRPNPMDLDTSCRCSLRAQAGDACAARTPVGAPITSSPSNTAEAVCLVEPPHAIPREGERDPPHPRCLPSPNEPPWRGGLPIFHKLSPACG
jgi:hypothetical protein